MAKILITVDTEENTLDVNVGGQSVPNVKNVSINCGPSYYEQDESEVCVNIMSYEEDEENDIKRFTTLVARDSADGRDAIARGARPLKRDKSLVVLREDRAVDKDISEYFAR